MQILHQLASCYAIITTQHIFTGMFIINLTGEHKNVHFSLPSRGKIKIVFNLCQHLLIDDKTHNIAFDGQSGERQWVLNCVYSFHNKMQTLVNNKNFKWLCRYSHGLVSPSLYLFHITITGIFRWVKPARERKIWRWRAGHQFATVVE